MLVIMGDGYFSAKTLMLCTDNFTEQEVLRLIKVLAEKFGVKCTKNKCINPMVIYVGGYE